MTLTTNYSRFNAKEPRCHFLSPVDEEELSQHTFFLLNFFPFSFLGKKGKLRGGGGVCVENLKNNTISVYVILWDKKVYIVATESAHFFGIGLGTNKPANSFSVHTPLSRNNIE